ncbi:MAG: hypothetical protein L0I97_05285 [Staphylococcus simulans]|nr:hypothetical protein [Staphylococcus simulans]
MTGKEYLAFFKDEDLKRSELVRLLERCIRILETNDLDAEEAKWLAIVIAEKEKERGVFL